MRKFLVAVFIGLVIILVWFLFPKHTSVNQNETMKEEKYNFDEKGNIVLPQPRMESNISIEQALLNRRSVRKYEGEPLTIGEISQILWSAQGITGSSGSGRTAPSAGALYPLEVYLVAKKVKGLEPGVYKYLPEGHKIRKILGGDVSDNLAKAALGQMFIGEAPASLVISAIFPRVTEKYGERGNNYVYMEAGHSAQNVYLQAESLGLGTVTVGAFDNEKVKEIVNLLKEETPLYIMPIGRIGEN